MQGFHCAYELSITLILLEKIRNLILHYFIKGVIHKRASSVNIIFLK